MQSKELSANELHAAALDELAQRHFGRAREYIDKALQSNPDSVEFLTTAGRIHNNDGCLEKAEQIFLRVVELQPMQAQGWFSLGHVLHRLDEHDKAIDAFERSLKLNPVSHAAHQRLGGLLLEKAQFDGAINHLNKALKLQPGNAEAHYNLGLVLHELGRFAEAQGEFSAVINLQPNDANAHSNLGAVLQSQGKMSDAVDEFQTALEIEPGHQPSVAALAGICDLRGDYQEGISLLESAIANADSPGRQSPVVLTVALAQLLNRVGREDEIPALLHTALDNNADEDPEMIPVLYTLGAYYDRVGTHDEAMRCFTAANAMHRVRFDSASHEHYVSHLIDWFDTDRMAALPQSGNTSQRPVFIVGMPRSGTSLVEQILASHSEVYGAGELDAIASLARLASQMSRAERGFPVCLETIKGQETAALAQQYLATLADADSDAARITDKMWRNFEYLGFIQLLFPDARVIHCRRDPRDVGLSCYFQSFGVAGPAFSYDLENIADYYRQYRRLMRHWDRVLEIKMLAVDYENLVAGPEQQVRRMLDFIGLEWDPECMRFDKNKRVVRTASHAQVREPIYTRSVGRYKNYASYIEPLLELCVDAES